MGWDERWVVVDVETTGLSPGRDRMIEIGAVAGEGDRIIDEFHSLIDPGRPVPWPAQRVHGITDAMLWGQPRPGEVMPDFHRFLGQSALVAHNAPFDLGFLRSEFARLGLGLTNRHHCTLQLSRRAFPSLPNHRLETVARHLFGRQFMAGAIHELPLHRALADARLTARVWPALNAGDHKDRPYGTAPDSLGRIMQAFKSLTTNAYIRGVEQDGWPPFPGRLWQRNYYERIIRNDDEWVRARQYIEENPMRWHLDTENPANIP